MLVRFAITTIAVGLAAVPACGGDAPPTDTAAVVSFSLDADLGTPEHYFDFPWPSDLRLTASGAPDVRGFPNPSGIKTIEQMRPVAMDRKKFPVLPVAYFRWSAPIAAQARTRVLAAKAESPILLIDLDDAAHHLYPVVAETPDTDGYIPANFLSVAPRPGIVLRPAHAHAFVVRRQLGDAAGKPLGVVAALAALAGDKVPDGARGAAAKDVYAKLWPAIDALGVPRSDVAAATVFTTADVVAENAAMSDALLKKHSVTVDGLTLYADEQKLQDAFCELKATVTLPQFQTGEPPFSTGGLFAYDGAGVPIKQRDEKVPLVVTIPRAPMPAAGYPLVIYFHGSGGLSTNVADYGRDVTPDMPEAGKGPAFYFAGKGIAAAAAALPVNPERLPGAGETAYLNITNLPALRDTFRQGIVEQRLILEALRTLTIDPAALAGCPGPTLPKGATAFRFDPDKLMAQGQSMGGMYTNLIAAVEPRIKAVVPTGAGGYWSYFVFTTHAIARSTLLLATLLGTDESIIDYMHPAMQLVEMVYEPVDPMVAVPRLARRPLAGHPVRPIFEPTQKGDSYFDMEVYDAMALAYGNQQAGDVVWPEMQQALALEGDDGVLGFPVKNNRKSESGQPYTGVAVQYVAEGNYDPHSIYRQLDSVKYQYGCFYETFLASGVATVPGKTGKPGDACPP